MNVFQLDLNEDDLRQRLVYFEQRLVDAERMSIAKEPLPAKSVDDLLLSLVRSKHLNAQKLAELQAKLETARDAEEEAK
jgi:hypothetical protein